MTMQVCRQLSRQRFSQISRQLRKQNRAAFTLIEVLVAMSMMAVVSVAVLMLFGTLSHQWGQNISRASATRSAAMALNRIAKETGMAMAYSASGGPGGKPYFTFPANTDASGNYIPTWVSRVLQYQPGTKVAYCVSDGTGATTATGTILWRQYLTGPGSWVPDQAWSLSPGSTTHGSIENLTALTFAIVGAATNYTVRISVTVKVTEGKQTNTVTVQRDVYLSNHN